MNTLEDFKDSARRLIIWGGVAVGLSLLRQWLDSRDDLSLSPKALKPKRPDPKDEVDFASDQSFPASDPPSWTQHH